MQRRSPWTLRFAGLPNLSRRSGICLRRNPTPLRFLFSCCCYQRPTRPPITTTTGVGTLFLERKRRESVKMHRTSNRIGQKAIVAAATTRQISSSTSKGGDSSVSLILHRRRYAECFRPGGTSTIVLQCRHHQYQQEQSFDSSYNVNTTIRRLSIATAGVALQRLRSSWMENSDQNQNHHHPERQHHHRRHHSTLPHSNVEEEATPTPTMMDYFAIFNVPRRYNLDMKDLKQRYLQLMNEHHPDKMNQRSAKEASSSESSSTVTANDITNAYQLLTEPHTRANHLLELIGYPILEDSCQSGGSGSSSSALVGMEFLLQVMEWRERIEELSLCTKHSNDTIPCSCGSEDKDQELRDLYQETQALQKKCEEELASLWNNTNSNVNEMTDVDLQRIRTLTAQLQYWHRLETTVREEMEL